MTTTIEAVYEQGILRLKEPIALAEGTVVEVTITASESSSKKKRAADVIKEGLVMWSAATTSLL